MTERRAKKKKAANKRTRRPKVLARRTEARAEGRGGARERDEADERGPSSSKKPGRIAPLVPEVSHHGLALPINVLPLFPDFVPDYEWVLGLVPMPGPAGAGRERPRPWAALFLEAGSGLVIHVDLLVSVTAKTVGATLRRAIARGEELGLRQPTRIRVGVPDQAPLLAEAERAGLELVVGPVPEVEEVLRIPGAVKVVALPTTDEVEVYRGTAEVSDAQLSAFFHAAEELRRGRFWRVLQSERPLVLRCPALGVGLGPGGLGGGAVVEVDERRGGVLITFEVDAMARIEERESPGEEPAGSLSIHFDRIGQLSAARRRELAGLHFAPRRGPYPVLSPAGDDGRLRGPQGSDYELATAVLLATSRFASEYGALTRRTSLRALVARYSVRLGRAHVVEVELGWPVTA